MHRCHAAKQTPKRYIVLTMRWLLRFHWASLLNSGHLLENLVFTALRQKYPEIYYYKTKKGREVDFVIPMQKGTRMLVQISESLADPKIKKREITALSEAMAELNLNCGTIVTRSESEQIKTDSGTIEVIPVWRFLLS